MQIKAGAIGPVLDLLRVKLDSWLGKPKRVAKESLVKLQYRYESEFAPEKKLTLKIEINTRERDHLYPLFTKDFSLDSNWYSGKAKITTYELNEIAGSKLRALYQRKKGRDLFDMAMLLEKKMIRPDKVVEAFLHYSNLSGDKITRAQFEANLDEKKRAGVFLDDMTPLLSSETEWSSEDAFERVAKDIITLLPGKPWRGTEK